jgi:uncharacterized protein (DUF433 family)
VRDGTEERDPEEDDAWERLKRPARVGACATMPQIWRNRPALAAVSSSGWGPRVPGEREYVRDGASCSIGRLVTPWSVTRRRSGAWVFGGIRVPVSALFVNLESGATVGEFMDWLPGATRDQINGVLEYPARSLAESVPA